VGADYGRVRLGIGHPGDKDRVTGHVLQDFAKADRAWLDPLLDAIAEQFPLLVRGDAGAFMSKVALAVNPPKPKKTKPRDPAEDPDGV
jgi:PTH1 family peptidyl-tRNA hydrolase